MSIRIYHLPSHAIHINIPLDYLLHRYLPNIVLIRPDGHVHRIREIHPRIRGDRDAVQRGEMPEREMLRVVAQRRVHQQRRIPRVERKACNLQLPDVHRVVHIDRYCPRIGVDNRCRIILVILRTALALDLEGGDAPHYLRIARRR